MGNSSGNLKKGETEVDGQTGKLEANYLSRDPHLTRKKLKVVINDNPFFRDRDLMKTVVYEKGQTPPDVTEKLYEPPLRRRMVECAVKDHEQRSKRAVCEDRGILYGRASRFFPAKVKFVSPLSSASSSCLPSEPPCPCPPRPSPRASPSSSDSFPKDLVRHSLPSDSSTSKTSLRPLVSQSVQVIAKPSETAADSETVSISKEEFINLLNEDSKAGKTKIKRVPNMELRKTGSTRLSR